MNCQDITLFSSPKQQYIIKIGIIHLKKRSLTFLTTHFNFDIVSVLFFDNNRKVKLVYIISSMIKKIIMIIYVIL